MLKHIILYTPMYVTFFWAVVLLSVNRRKNRAKHFLGIFMIAAFLIYLSHAIFFNHDASVYIYFDTVYLFGSLSVYPLYYWYIKLLTIENGYNPRNLRTLIPALLLAVFSLIIYIIMSEEARGLYIRGFLFDEAGMKGNSTLILLQKGNFIVTRLVFTVQIIYYLIAGQKLVKNYNREIANFYSNLENKTILWVNFLLYSFVVTSIASMVFNMIGRAYFLDVYIVLSIPSIIFSVLLFIIGLQGFMQNHTVRELKKDERMHVSANFKSYNLAQLKENLLDLFRNENIYRQTDLKITQVALLLNTNRTYISNLINNEFSCSFSEFVNQYRIIDAKRMLSDESLSSYSLEYISDTVGFGSVSTFIRAFRESEGITPGRYGLDKRMMNKPTGTERK